MNLENTRLLKYTINCIRLQVEFVRCFAFTNLLLLLASLFTKIRKQLSL